MRDVTKNLQAGLDLAARLSILEGATGMPAGTWVARGAAALPAVRGRLREMPDLALDPAWTGTADTGLWAESLAYVERAMACEGVTREGAEDIMQRALCGLGVRNEPCQNPLFWFLGQKLSNHVLRRRTPPASITSSARRFLPTLLKYLRGKVINEINVTRAEGVRLAVLACEPRDDATRMDGMQDLMMGGSSPKLAAGVHAAMRATWRDWSPLDRKYLDFWLDTLVRDGRSVGTSEIARAFAKNPLDATEVRGLTGGGVNRAWVKYKATWPAFKTAFWASEDGMSVEDLIDVA